MVCEDAIRRSFEEYFKYLKEQKVNNEITEIVSGLLTLPLTSNKLNPILKRLRTLEKDTNAASQKEANYLLGNFCEFGLVFAKAEWEDWRVGKFFAKFLGKDVFERKEDKDTAMHCAMVYYSTAIKRWNYPPALHRRACLWINSSTSHGLTFAMKLGKDVDGASLKTLLLRAGDYAPALRDLGFLCMDESIISKAADKGDLFSQQWLAIHLSGQTPKREKYLTLAANQNCVSSQRTLAIWHIKGWCQQSDPLFGIRTLFREWNAPFVYNAKRYPSVYHLAFDIARLFEVGGKDSQGSAHLEKNPENALFFYRLFLLNNQYPKAESKERPIQENLQKNLLIAQKIFLGREFQKTTLNTIFPAPLFALTLEYANNPDDYSNEKYFPNVNLKQEGQKALKILSHFAKNR